ncbi:MAG: IscA/HesB family protein [Desulfovibrio sp.]|nr:IscA/HesB family protein [Desulfovibrio sp.]
MIELSADAQKELENFFSDKQKEPIRIYAANGCGGPRLALALDKPGADDQSLDVNGFSFCISNELLDQVKSVKIDLSYMGFVLEPGVPLPDNGGSACGSCCGGCGSH